MNEPLDPWWRDVHHAAQLLASALGAAVTRAGRDGVYTPPPGSPPGRRRRRPASLRHLAEIIHTHRMAPGLSVDKDIVAAVLAGNLRYITDPTAVVAVARAAHHIGGMPFGPDDARRLTVACEHIATLVAAAQDADRRAFGRVPAVPPGEPLVTQTPHAEPDAAAPVLDAYFTTRRPVRRWSMIAAIAALVLLAGGTAVVAAYHTGAADSAGPAANPSSRAIVDNDCRLGAASNDIIMDAMTVFEDNAATRLDPTLDFDEMNGSARYARHDGRTYYWGRAGSDDENPRSGGARIRWKTSDGPWRSCATPLAVTERGYVHTPAVATTIGGRAVTIQVCLWRDTPPRENCLDEISTG
ncbi:hypothetical protein [Actinoplanes teichomyceticus]|uniref:hypothetical protein n=1 Tax=Actinoplanes teichomyceticus TaxID=1867 RepID=UPI0011A8B9DD|nr:hypothetical protein [Actinoplanes teichomyceticus]